jgi:hypothetical protein
MGENPKLNAKELPLRIKLGDQKHADCPEKIVGLDGQMLGDPGKCKVLRDFADRASAAPTTKGAKAVSTPSSRSRGYPGNGHAPQSTDRGHQTKAKRIDRPGTSGQVRQQHDKNGGNGDKQPAFTGPTTRVGPRSYDWGTTQE